MFPSEYTVRQHNLDLLREAERQRLARLIRTSQPTSQRLGQALIRLGMRLAAAESDECTTVVAHGRTVTVCTA